MRPMGNIAPIVYSLCGRKFVFYLNQVLRANRRLIRLADVALGYYVMGVEVQRWITHSCETIKAFA